MSSIVSSIVGGQAQNNVATTQQQASNYSVDVGARTAEDQQALSKALGEESIAEEKYGVDTEANTAKYTTDVGANTAKYTTDVGAKTAAEQLAEKAQEFGSTQDIASKQLATSAADINSATASAPSELLQEQSDIANKGTRSMQDISKQVGANLATSGVRGGQAAILQNRAVGEAGVSEQENIDQLLAEDAEQRMAAKTGYDTAVGGTAMGKV